MSTPDPVPPAWTPLVSVLTPSYNQARWLADNLDSVAHQSYPRIEHVVVDGASTDGSVDLLGRAAGPHVAWTSEPDRGQSHALNVAFARSRGEIVGWLNSDDAYFSATAVAEAVAAFARHPDVDVVYGHAVLTSGDGLIAQVIWAPRFRGRLLRLHDFLTQPAVFIRRAAITDRFVDDSFDFAMDYELWLRLASKSRFLRLDRILAIDRHQLDRKSATRVDVMEADRLRLGRQYGVATGRRGVVLRKALKIALRLAGVVKLRAAIVEPLAFDGRRDGFVRLLVRQVALPRAAMPLGPDPPRSS